MRSAVVPVGLFGLLALTDCGVNTVPWPGTHVTHVVQSPEVIAAPVPQAPEVIAAQGPQVPEVIAAPAPQDQREASVPSKPSPPSHTAPRAGAETPARTTAARPALAARKPSANPVPGSAEWQARKAKQDREDAKKDRELANTIGAICHGC